MTHGVSPVHCTFARLCLVSAGHLLFPPSAVAQGSVTLYGLLDTSLEVTNPGSGWAARLDSGAYRGSRVGLRGRESLGADLQLVLALESGFSSADGALAIPGTLFNRQACIGAQGRWGEVRVGRQYSPLYIPFKGDLDAFGAGTIASGLSNLSKITPYASNAFTYLSPMIAGFTTTLMVAMRDSSANDGNGIAGYYVMFEYQLGAMSVQYARQQTHGAEALRANVGGVSYDFGRLRGWLTFFNGDGGSPAYHAAGGSISAQYWFSTQSRVSVGYARALECSSAGAGANQLSAAFEYDVSRTLQLYFNTAYLSNRGSATFTLRSVNVTGLPVAYPGAPVRGVQLGLIKRF
ncbi:porin [Pararobbsia alpina]|uniref:Porin domain-containing protein n=1 Tax=Pararobbsia alpina TaxID=621374 RepID=A0A6S7CAJ3_9BURK|nr:porin [Pararobbsia alpina]CAB3804609.1 hypothetical protein LMG28138_05541 [Pararobbsia alpina]